MSGGVDRSESSAAYQTPNKKSKIMDIIYGSSTSLDRSAAMSR